MIFFVYTLCSHIQACHNFFEKIKIALQLRFQFFNVCVLMYQSARLFDLDTNTGICIQKAPYIIYHIRKVASTNNLKKIKTTSPPASKGKCGLFYTYCSTFLIVGNSKTSRIDCASVNSITIRSIPIPKPPVGGIPVSKASKNSSSSGCASSLPSAFSFT